jgi:hypothetical protein
MQGVDLRDTAFVKAIVDLLLLGRPNAPQFRSTRWVWVDVLAHGLESGAVTLLKGDVLLWPWTNTFAEKVANAGPGDPVLGGKLHPLEFDHNVHIVADLPADPLLAGCTVSQILSMRRRGVFDNDRYIPAHPRMAAANQGTQHARPIIVVKTEDLEY